MEKVPCMKTENLSTSKSAIKKRKWREKGKLNATKAYIKDREYNKQANLKKKKTPI